MKDIYIYREREREDSSSRNVPRFEIQGHSKATAESPSNGYCVIMKREHRWQVG